VGVDEVVGVGRLLGAILQRRVHVVGQGVAEHLPGHILGVDLAVEAAPAGAGHRHRLGIHHQLRGRRGGIGALGVQVLVDDGQDLVGPEGGQDVQVDVGLQGVGGRQGVALAVRVGDHVAAPHPDTLVHLLEVAVGLAQAVRVRPAQVEIVVRIQAELGPLGQQAAGGGIHAQGFLGMGASAQRAGSEGGSEIGQGEPAPGGRHGQLLWGVETGRNGPGLGPGTRRAPFE
jgi:hypothetical protein